MSKTLLISGVVLLLVLAGVIGYFFFRPAGVNIGLEFSAPSQILVGQPIKVDVSISNLSDKIINNARLSLSLPDGVAFVSQGQDQRVREQVIGDLGPGSLNQQSFNLIVLDGENSIKRLGAKLVYSLDGSSSAQFQQQSNFDLAVGQSAVAVTLDSPEKVFGGENFEITVNFQNNTAGELKNSHLTLEYPPSFQFQKASVDPDRGNNYWNLGVLSQGESGNIKIRGNLLGSDESVFPFNAILDADFQGQNYTLTKQTANVAIASSPLNLRINVNGGGPDYVAHIGDTLEYVLHYKNTLNVPLQNATVRAVLTGEQFDFKTLGSQAAFNSLSNTLTWNAANTPELGNINPGGEGEVRASIRLKSAFAPNRLGDKNYALKMNSTIESPTVPAGTSASKTISVASLETKLAGQLTVDTRGYFRDAASGILNSGPYPPKVNTPTQYTIHWQVKNYSTDVSGTRVSAFLQNGARFTGVVKSPLDAKPEYNPNSSEISWNIGDLIATKGIVGGALEAVFQIEYTPPTTQVGQSPALLGETTITGTDGFTGLTLNATDGQIRLDLPDDGTLGSNRQIQP